MNVLVMCHPGSRFNPGEQIAPRAEGAAILRILAGRGISHFLVTWGRGSTRSPVRQIEGWGYDRQYHRYQSRQSTAVA